MKTINNYIIWKIVRWFLPLTIIFNEGIAVVIGVGIALMSQSI